jgi:hypothetical protein
MIIKKILIICLFFTTSILLGQNKEVDNLLEKVNQAPTTKVKKVLIEQLKEKLAKENKKVRAEADAIIKAKQKIPLKIYKQNPSRK